MALTLTVDYAEKVILEPGYHKSIGAGDALAESQVDSPADTPGLWAAPGTNVVMLRPLNISNHWLNSPDQIASIIRASAMVINITDASNNVVYEEYAFGNPNNFYIYHAPVGFTGTPFAPAPDELPAPSVGPPSIIGAPFGGDLSGGLVSIEAEHEIPFYTYNAPNTPVGSVADGKLICYTRDPLPANQAFYFRWHEPDAHIGYQTRHIFYFGQLALEVAGNMVYLYTDTSAHMDRSHYGRIWAAPMFSRTAPRELDFTSIWKLAYSWGVNLADPPEGPAHDRALLIIPYFRNRLLISSYAGNSQSAAYSPRVSALPKRAPAGSDHEWEITREATVGVWVMTPAPGRFQLQKVRYANGPATLDLSHVSLDYTPAVPPVVQAFKDADHGTAITGTVSHPPVYSPRFNNPYICPNPTTAANDQSLTYGLQLTFTGEATHRWTPFFYGLTFDAPTVLQPTTTTPVNVLDTGVPTTNLLRDGMISWGDEPGDGRMEIHVQDESPYAFAPYYYRSELPVQLDLDGTKVFTGLSDMIEVEPLHEVLRPRNVKLPASDRWKQLAHYRLRDQGTKTGIGHITTVLNIAAQAGIDTTTAETPPINATTNTALGLWDSTIPRTEEESELIRGAWKPHPEDTAAEFIMRICKLFSGWDVGFRPDGRLFYLPKNFFTSIAVRFFHSRAAAVAAGLPNNPLCRNVIHFETAEPEANAVVIIGAADSTGHTLTSSYFVDWASIRNPAVQNYLGRWKPVAIRAPGVFSCPELNWIAMVVFDAVRRRHRRISFEGHFVPGLKYGQVIEVGTYGQYRVKKCKVEFTRTGWAAATYEAELVELGFGL